MSKSIFIVRVVYIYHNSETAAGAIRGCVSGVFLVPEALEGAGFLLGALPFLDPFFVTGAGALSVASVSVLGRAAGNGEV